MPDPPHPRALPHAALTLALPGRAGDQAAAISPTSPLDLPYISQVEQVIKQLRKLPWSQPGRAGGGDAAAWVHRAVMELGAVKWQSVPLVACVVSGLYRYQARA